MALGYIGIGQKISELTDAAGDVERECNFWYDIARDQLLENGDWPMASKQATLGLVSEDPNTDWSFSYRYPPTCLVARRIVGAGGTASAHPLPYQLGQDSIGRLIYTDVEDAVLEGTFWYEDPGEFTNSFAEALAWHLATKLAMPLSVDMNKFQNAQQMSGNALQKARGISSQERRMKPAPQSLFVRSRGSFPRVFNDLQES
jgi:hypothetical protein